MHHREAHLIGRRVIRPDLGDDHLMLGAEPTCGVERVGRDVEIKRHAQAAERPPLRHGFEGVDRLAGLDFDGALKLASAFGAVEDQIGVDGKLT
jgi:hypothetical protein